MAGNAQRGGDAATGKPAAGGLADWFSAGLAAAADRPALRIGRLQWTYADLHEIALRIAGAIRCSGDGAPRAVGVLASRSIECYAGILAAMYAGAAAVPLSPGFPPERTIRMARAAGITAVIADRQGARALSALAAAQPGLAVIALDPGLPAPEQARVVPAAAATALARPERVPPGDPAYVLFTSGSTGRPKGVPVTHASMAHFLTVNRARYGLSPADACSQTFDCTFDLAMFDLFVTWSAGAVLVSTPPQAFLALPEFAARHRLTLWFSVPSAIPLVRRRGLAPGSLPSLRWSLFCGEPLLMADAVSWQDAAPGARLENLYGPTELTIACSAYRWDPALSPALCTNGVVPVGPLYPGLRGLLLTESGEVSDREGELCVAGPQMFGGYLDPRDSEGRFVTRAGERWYRTGDLMASSAGAGLAYRGRVDNLVKIRGYRVELAELEWHARAVPGVEHAVVVPVDGADSRRLFAWYCGEPGSAGPIREHLRAVVPEFMVPHWIRDIDQLPLSANGKVDRAELAGMAQRAVAAMAAAPAG